VAEGSCFEEAKGQEKKEKKLSLFTCTKQKSLYLCTPDLKRRSGNRKRVKKGLGLAEDKERRKKGSLQE
jgi:hypothetical protein